MRRWINVWCWIAAGVTVACPVGCKQPVAERKYYAVSGTATGIDVQSGLVSMNWIRAGQPIEAVTGRLTHESEILINGVSASLEDIRVGDRAVATVYPAPLGDSVAWIVTSVMIDREESFILSQPTTVPTSLPAMSAP